MKQTNNNYSDAILFLTMRKLIIYILQREARGSVTFKIVPSYRSAPPPCEVGKSFFFILELLRVLLATPKALCSRNVLHFADTLFTRRQPY